MYQAETQGVRVTAVPSFMEGESSPAQGRYFWAYTIEILNLSPRTVQLMSPALVHHRWARRGS